MPELVPAWERLTAMIPGDPEAGAALALWNPPPFLTGCSQAAVLAGGPALIRNYDWDYRLLDGVVARTEYTGRRVLGMLDCLWGLLDGINDAGLAVSLTFGGRPGGGCGLRHPAGDPLCAGDLRDSSRGGAGAAQSAGPHVL